MMKILFLTSVLLSAAWISTASTMIGGSDKLTIDTTAGDTVSVDSCWHQGSTISIRLSTVWNMGEKGLLTIGGRECATLATDEEKDYQIRIPANSAGIYSCVFTVGDVRYERMIVTTGVRRSNSGSSIVLDTRSGMREAASVEHLRYDAAWNASAVTARIMDTSKIIAEGNSGSVDWSIDSCEMQFLCLDLLDESGNVVFADKAAYRGLGHLECTNVVALASTCTEDGYTAETKCSRCGLTLSKSQTQPALGHSEVVMVEAVVATCTTAGRTKGSYCSRCNVVLTTSTEIPASGHNEVVTTEAVVATCTTPGRTKGVNCSHCKETFATSTEIPALGHNEVVTIEAIAATCTTAGRTKGSYCSRCNVVLAASSEIPALGHSEVVTTEAMEATCTTAGRTKGSYCSRCNAVVAISREISAWGHNEVVTIEAIAATCTTVGRTKGSYCSRCNVGLASSSEIPVLGHSEVVTTEAIAETCTTAGRTKGSYCSRCNEVLTISREISAWGHNEVVTTTPVAATCTTAGRTKGSYCSRCGEALSISGIVPASHSGAITKLEVSPTSSSAGSTAEIICSRCSTVLQEAATIPALGYVRNVTARQLWPYQKVAIDFEAAPDLAETVGEDAVLSLNCRSGSSTKTTTASFIIGDRSTKSGIHRIVWDMAKDGVSANASDLVFTVSYGSKSGSSSATKVNTSLSLNVAGEASLGYSPIDTDSAEVFVDGVQILSATNSGAFVWQPTTLGSHTLKHVAGTNLWTKTVKVISLAAASAPSPNPPTAEDANIKIGSTTKNFATSAKGSGAITTSGSGTWSATASDDWITISIASRTAGLPLAYQVAANTGVESRTGYIYVSGNVFTITQAGVGAELETTSAAFDADGGEGSFTVVADTSASWRAQSDVDWISLANTTGTGQVAVVYNVAPWNSVSTRSGTITAAGCTFTVNQTGRLMKLSAHEVSEDYQSHVIDLAMNALSDVEWNIWLGAPWISVVDGGNGKGGDNIALAINENPSYLPRTGRVAVGTEELAITQTGRPTAALDFAISPTQTTGSVDGANGLITVTATPDLPWTAKSDVSWLTLLASFASGDGNGNVIYTVSPNSTMTERHGTITVSPAADSGLSAKTHAVTQPAATSLVSDSAHDFDAAGDSFDVGVTVADVVAWTVEENCSWISIDGDTSRVGPGTVTIRADANTTVDARSASVTIAGHPFTVSQAGRTVEVEYTSKVFGTESDSGTIDVHPNGNVSWTATTKDLDWIIIWAGEGCTLNDDGSVSGTGDATVEFMVTDYVGDGTPRVGTITVGDKTVYVTQRAYELSINPTGETVAGNAGQGEVGVPASVGDVWNAIATAPWITIASGYDKGTGSGKVMFTYTENDTGAERTGKIVIAGEEYTLTQAARQMVTVAATCAGGKGAVSGAGRYDLGTSVTLKATAQDGYEFTGWTLADGSTATGASVSVVADVDKAVIANFRRIPVYLVNGESVRENTVVSFVAPADVVDAAGTTKLVCRGSSAFADKGAAFSLKVTGDVSFDWDLWTTNYWVAINQTEGGTVSGTTGWVAADAEVTFTATPAAGNSLYRWAGFDGGRGATALPSVTVRVSRPMTVSASFGLFADTLATALDAADAGLVFTTGGDAAWAPVIDATAECGYSSACSGAIGAESETWLETTVEGAGVLTFKWRVDCERDDGGGVTWDRLSVFTNNVEAARIDGRTAWQTVALPVGGGGGGKTTVRWSFYRDDYDEGADDCENCGWVDQVIWKEAK